MMKVKNKSDHLEQQDMEIALVLCMKIAYEIKSAKPVLKIRGKHNCTFVGAVKTSR